MNDQIVSGPMLQWDQKCLVAKINNKTQSEITAELLDSKMSDSFLNSVTASFTSKKEGITAEVAKAHYHKAINDQTQ